MVKVTWKQAVVRLGTGDQGIGCVHRLDAADLQGAAMGRPGRQSQDCAGAAEPRFLLPAPMHASLPSAGMHNFRYRLCHPRSVPCFPWCVLWERRGNSRPHCRPHTWVAAGAERPPLPAASWVQRGPSRAVPPAWESSWEVLGQGSSVGGGMFARDGVPLSLPTQAVRNPDAQVLLVSLGAREVDASSHAPSRVSV